MIFSGDSRWFLLHKSCLDQNTTSEELNYLFKIIRDSLSYGCIDHLDEFLVDNPIPLLHGHYTRFCWSVKLHNYINEILNRDVITIDQAISIYATKGYCAV